MENYSFRLLSVDDLGLMDNLYFICFNKKKGRDYFNWKYFSNPSGNAIVAGAFFNGELVSSGAMLIELIDFFGEHKTIYKCTDLMTHPEHQHRGLSKKISEQLNSETLKTGCPFAYAFGSEIATKILLKNNWSYINEVINFFKPYALLKVNYALRAPDLNNITFHDLIPDELRSFEFNKNSSYIGIRKSPDYLKWRTSCPLFSYKTILSCDKSGKINGYLIYSIPANNLMNVIDFEASDQNNSVIQRLFACAEYTVVKNKYKGILFLTVRDSPLFHFIKSRNYLNNPFKTGPLKSILGFNVILYNKNYEAAMNIKNWKVSALNYDDI